MKQKANELYITDVSGDPEVLVAGEGKDKKFEGKKEKVGNQKKEYYK